MSALDSLPGHTDDLAYCPRCASAWWVPVAININLDGKPTGYAYPLRCHECGHEKEADR